jgi:hypothetical protein
MALAGSRIWARFKRWREKDPRELERRRRLDVNRRGRISAAKIVDLVESETGEGITRLLLYKYEVAGVTYEVAQEISTLPRIAALAPLSPGQTASIKYDPQRPANSIIACEEWCGLPRFLSNDDGEPEPLKSRVES